MFEWISLHYLPIVATLCLIVLVGIFLNLIDLYNLHRSSLKTALEQLQEQKDQNSLLKELKDIIRLNNI